VFFEGMDIPTPDYNLLVGSGTHAKQTADMMVKIEEVIDAEKPDLCIVYGDTNSTLAGAVVAAKKNVRIMHIEAGLRSYNKEMPEEINRTITDHISDYLICPSKQAIANLEYENVRENVYDCGDIMYDTLLHYSNSATKSEVLKKLSLKKNGYYLLTLHRPYNVDNQDNFLMLMCKLNGIGLPIIYPKHPRVKHEIDFENIIVVDPQPYIDMLALQMNAKKVITDSGGLQKEAYLLKKECVTIRTETEWTETLNDGWNVLTDKHELVEYVLEKKKHDTHYDYYGDGKCIDKIIDIVGAI
jgi:UDP-GlcNAc3NAcA epimerase